MGQKLYVGNLSYDTTEDSLRDHFSAAGTVTDVAVITDRATGRSRGFAFVTMGSDDEAKQARDSLDGKDLDGRPLKIDEARDRPPRGGGGGGDRY